MNALWAFTAPYQEDFEDLDGDGVIDKCQLISIIHQSFR